MKRAVFLDRDGTINEDVGHITDPDRFELIPGATDAIRRLKDAGYFLVLATNQAGVARGLMTEPQLLRVLGAFEDLLERPDAELRRIADFFALDPAAGGWLGRAAALISGRPEPRREKLPPDERARLGTDLHGAFEELHFKHRVNIAVLGTCAGEEGPVDGEDVAVRRQKVTGVRAILVGS